MEKAKTIKEELKNLDKQREEVAGVLSTYKTPDLDKSLKSANRRLNTLRKIMAKGRRR